MSTVEPTTEDTTDIYQWSEEAAETSDFVQVTNPSSVYVLPEDCTRGETIEHLSKMIPTNEYGLPLFYVRSDLMDLGSCVDRGSVYQDDMDAASELLSYTDGYPTQRSGAPFWSKLPHEPHPSYLLFQRFIELAEVEGIRLIDSLAHQEQLELADVRETSLEYYWSSRARAYDLFIVAAEAKKREALTRRMENAHYNVAGSLLEKVITKFNSDPNLIENMDAKELIDTFETLVKIQRLSLGLTGANSSSTAKDLQSPGASAEVIIRTLTKNSGLTDQTADAVQNRLQLLMADKDTAMSIQEMIVRVTGAGDRT